MKDVGATTDAPGDVNPARRCFGDAADRSTGVAAALAGDPADLPDMTEATSAIQGTARFLTKWWRMPVWRRRRLHLTRRRLGHLNAMVADPTPDELSLAWALELVELRCGHDVGRRLDWHPALDADPAPDPLDVLVDALAHCPGAPQAGRAGFHD